MTEAQLLSLCLRNLLVSAMEQADAERLTHLVSLIQKRNAVDADIAKVIGRPAMTGHVGEYLAAYLFDIQLEESASRRGSDGSFRSGPLVGRSVNVKWYLKRESRIDITPGHLPDYYLVLAGPPAPGISSRGTTRPMVVHAIYMFETISLMDRLISRNVKIGIATSLKNADWDAARVDFSLPDQRIRVSATSANNLLQLLGHVAIV